MTGMIDRYRRQRPDGHERLAEIMGDLVWG
jgi:hypothetical protein